MALHPCTEGNPARGYAINIIQRLNDVQDAASHRAVIRVYDESGTVIETHEHAGEFKEP